MRLVSKDCTIGIGSNTSTWQRNMSRRQRCYIIARAFSWAFKISFPFIPTDVSPCDIKNFLNIKADTTGIRHNDWEKLLFAVCREGVSALEWLPSTCKRGRYP
jgi:hypothetical protein